MEGGWGASMFHVLADAWERYVDKEEDAAVGEEI